MNVSYLLNRCWLIKWIEILVWKLIWGFFNKVWFQKVIWLRFHLHDFWWSWHFVFCHWLLVQFWQSVNIHFHFDCVLNLFFFLERDLDLNSSVFVTDACSRVDQIFDIVLSAELVPDIFVQSKIQHDDTIIWVRIFGDCCTLKLCVVQKILLTQCWCTYIVNQRFKNIMTGWLSL